MRPRLRKRTDLYRDVHANPRVDAFVFAWLLVGLVTITALGCGTSTRQEQRDADPRGTSLLGEAQQAYRNGAYARTIQLVDSAAIYAPELPDVWFLRGLVLADVYRFDESDAAFETTLALDPEYRSARYNMGHNAFEQSSSYAKDAYRVALEHYRAEENLLRNAAEEGTEETADQSALAAVLLQIGTTYWNLNLPDSAILTYHQALDVDSAAATGYAWLAGSQQSAGDLDEAVANARRAVDIEPGNAEHRLLLGVLLSETGNHDEAMPHLEFAASGQPWNRTAIYNLGQALIGAGRTQAGEVHLARADSLEMLRSEIERSHIHVFQDPDDPIRWENYAFLLQRAGRFAEAREAIGVMRYLAQSDTSSG